MSDSEPTDTDHSQDTHRFDASAFLRTVTSRPGVYRMFNKHEDIIYVGKASNLKNRLSSYFQKTLDNRKTQAPVLLKRCCLNKT